MEFIENVINNEDIVIKAKGKQTKELPTSKTKKR